MVLTRFNATILSDGSSGAVFTTHATIDLPAKTWFPTYSAKPRMKRINEKVKDIVEVRKFASLNEFTANPSATLAAYHFTDGTSELMAKWLDRVVGAQDGRGNSFALAGYRGVGKSHFLATLAAIVSQPELRSKISDSHVAAGAQALLRRRYSCIFVRRGTKPGLMEELKDAIGAAFGVDGKELPERIFDLLSVARSRSADVPFLILVDTAIERGSRVTRDDGPVLAEIAETASSMNAFVGVALDDDIAGADGTNSDIVRAFTIDYLDQEHLYKVVDSFVFPKNQQLRSVLHDVYEYFREVMPTFRWSEQRFMSLYPLHPAILDVAPFVRLYVHNFALLGFAAEAGERILGRPANSLIALDEVFDSADAELRKVDDLREAFEAYDRLNSDVVAKIPVMQRLQAKLILKALLLLSLEGQGTTASEISSGMLIFDESDPQKAKRTVEEIIRMFAAALPDDVRVYAEEGREVRYGLPVTDKDNLNKALNEAASSLDNGLVDEIVQRAFHDRFADSTFYSLDGNRKNAMECVLHWRGGMRRGRISWLDGHFDASAAGANSDDSHDWELTIDRLEKEAAAGTTPNELPKATWKPADLSPDEIETLLRLHVLQTDTKFREENGDKIRGALHSHTLLLDRIISRIFLEDGRLVIDNFDYNLSDEARNAGSLSALFSTMLEPMFEVRFPQHPYFLQRLGLSEVGSLVSDLYSGSRQKLADVQKLAQTFALPLGLVRLIDGVYYPSTAEALMGLNTVERVMGLLDASAKNSVDLKAVYAELKKPPFGLVHEAQQLVMAAMVSQRMIEFVTSKGDRINQRSLDLKIIWDDIVGLARPEESAFSLKKLTKWAVAITGDESFKSLGTESESEKLTAAFSDWLAEWDSKRILNRFNSLPEESLNIRIWRSVARASKTLGAAAAAIRKFLEGSIIVDECLGRISEAFLDDLSNFESANDELRTVEAYLESFDFRQTVTRFVDLSESTDDTAIEGARDSLCEALRRFEAEPGEELNRQIGYIWSKFNRDYSNYFVERHDSVMRSHKIQEDLDSVLRGDQWWMFSNLAAIIGVDSEEVRGVSRLKREMDRIVCSADTRSHLEHFPFCKCGYQMSRHQELESAVLQFQAAIEIANRSLQSSLISVSNQIVPVISRIAASSGDAEIKVAGEELSKTFSAGNSLHAYSINHLQLLAEALREVSLSSRIDYDDDFIPETKLNRKSRPEQHQSDDAVLSVA